MARGVLDVECQVCAAKESKKKDGRKSGRQAGASTLRKCAGRAVKGWRVGGGIVSDLNANVCEWVVN